MARARDPNRDKAYELWKQSNGEIKLKDIANQFGISEGTVRGWKNKDNWDNGTNGTFQSKKRNGTKNTERSKEKKQRKKEASSEVRVPVIENDDLTDKQRLFVGYYLKYWNATKAYQKAYGCDYDTARNNGSRLLANACIKAEVIRTRDEMFAESFLSSRAIIQKYMDIAFADIADLVEFGVEEKKIFKPDGRPIVDHETGQQATYKRSFVYFRNPNEIDSSLISEVKQGKDGVSIKLHDKMKALEKLEKYIGLMTEEERLKLEKLKAEVKSLELKENEEATNGLGQLADAIKGSFKKVSGKE